MSLRRFSENGEIEGYMSESLAEHYGLKKVTLNEFIHKFEYKGKNKTGKINTKLDIHLHLW